MKENAGILTIDEAQKQKEELCKRCYERWTPTLIRCGNCMDRKFCYVGQALVNAARKAA